MITDTLTLKLEIGKIKKQLSDNGKNVELVFDFLDALIYKKETTGHRKRIGYKSD